MAAPGRGVGSSSEPDEPPKLRGEKSHEHERTGRAAYESGAFESPSASPPPIGSLKEAYEALPDKSKPTLLAFVKLRPLALQYFPDEMKEDPEIVLTAYEADPRSLRLADDTTQFEIVAEHPEAINYCADAEVFMHSPPHVIEWIKAHRRLEEIVTIPEEMLDIFAVAQVAVQVCEEALALLSDRLKVEVALTDSTYASSDYLLQKDADLTLPAEWENSAEHMRIAIRINPKYYHACSPELQQDRSICWEVAQIKPIMIKHLPKDFQFSYLSRNVHLVLRVYRKGVPAFLMGIKAVALHVLTSQPERYHEVSDALKDDLDIINLAKRDKMNVPLFSESNQKRVILENPSLIELSIWLKQGSQFPDEFYESDELVNEIVKYAPNQYIAKRGRIRVDLDAAKELIAKEPNWLNCLEIEVQEQALREDPELFRFFMIDDEHVLERFSPELVGSPVMMTPLIIHHPECYESLPDSLKSDRLFITECIEKQPKLIRCMPPDDAMRPFAMGLVIKQRKVVNSHMIAVNMKRRRDFWFGLMFDLREEKEREAMDRLNRKASDTPQIAMIGEAGLANRGLLTDHLDELLELPDHLMPIAMQILFQTGDIEAVRAVQDRLLGIKGPLKRAFRNNATGLQMQMAMFIALIKPADNEEFVTLFNGVLDKIIAARSEVQAIDLLKTIILLPTVYPIDEIPHHLHGLIDERDEIIDLIGGILAIITEFLSKIFGDGIEGIERLPTYKRSFDKLCKYAADNSIDVEPILFPLIQTFIRSALAGTFTSERMSLDGNRNLQLLNERDPEFYAAWKDLHDTEIEYDSHKVIISGDWEDHFCMGAEVLNSCQDPVKYSTGFARGLMGYCMDGRDHLLAIKDEGGKIRARANLRFGFIEDKPVLFLAQPLARSTHDKRLLKNALLKAGQEVARRLGVPLLDHSHAAYGTGAEMPMKAAHFEKGRAPYVYDDISHKLHKETFRLPALFDISSLNPEA